MDLSKVTFPTFVLEPRSMLERITDFMAHPDLIFGQVIYISIWSFLTQSYSAEEVEDPEERFIRVLQYYLAGWHIKPKGVKKPYVIPSLVSKLKILNILKRYNPVLGEFFRCKYEYQNGTTGFYIAEQGMWPSSLKIGDFVLIDFV